MKIAEFSGIKWAEYGDNPVIRAPFPSPIIADPTFLAPGESPDGRWHLFAHSLMGIHHYVSDDGIRFEKLPGLVCGNAMRPYIFREGDRYYLYYEKTRRFILWFSWMPVRWKSNIELRTSTDLRRWSEPVTVLGPTLPWHRDREKGESVSNPCVVKSRNTYLLYYSASLVFIPDCGFNEPLHIGVAESRSPEGPFTPHPMPIISPSPDKRWCNLGAGSFKAVRLSDGFAGFENGIYWDSERGRSGSAILTFTSKDGYSWKPAGKGPLVKPEGTGWKQSHVYALDAKAVDRRSWRLYFNARSDWHWTRGREAIGLLDGFLRR